MRNPLERAEGLASYSSALRQEFHRYPELGFQEYKTAEILLRELSRWEDYKVRSGIAGTGVLASLEGEIPGRTVLLRFDMDALPIQEETGAPYASEHEGLMHACGHDGHMAIGLTCARLLAESQGELAGTVKILFQPAEEGLGGALKTIQGGVLEDPRPDLVLGMHLWNEKPLGWLGISPGAVMSASDNFQVRIRGKGGHGAKPHEAVDPIATSAEVISSLQTLVSRELHPLDSAVVSVCSVHAGEAHNVIPAEAVLTGTVRTFSASTREALLTRFEILVKGIAEAHRCQAAIHWEDISPAVVNHPETAGAVQKTARKLFPEAEIDDQYRTMASEDMAFFLQEIPGCYSFVGSSNPEKGLDAKHHQADFDFDERALVTGSALMTGVTLDLLGS